MEGNAFDEDSSSVMGRGRRAADREDSYGKLYMQRLKPSRLWAVR